MRTFHVVMVCNSLIVQTLFAGRRIALLRTAAPMAQ